MADEPTNRTTNYSNSHKSKNPEAASSTEASDKKPLDRVTTSDPVRVKKPLGRKIAEQFKGDDVRSVGNYVLMDVLIPQAKAALSDAVTSGFERFLFGDARRSSSGGVMRAGYTAYNRMSTTNVANREQPRTLSQRARATHDFAEIVLDDRGEAEVALDTLREQIDQYNATTVSDLYSLVGITGNFTDNKWGWTDLREAAVRRDRRGWLLDLPNPVELK